MKFKNSLSLFNILGIILGIILGVLVFLFIQNKSINQYKKNLIPNAQKAYQNKDYSNAISLYQKALKEFPENNDVKRSLAEVFYLKGMWEDSLKSFLSINNQNLKDSDYDKIGSIYFQKNDFENTIKYWKNKKISPQNTYLLANIFYEKNDFDNYFAELKKIQNYQEPNLLLQIKEDSLENVLKNIEESKRLPKISNQARELNLENFQTQIQSALTASQSGKTDYSELIQIAAFSNLGECRVLFDRIKSLRQQLSNRQAPDSQLDYYEGLCFNQINQPDKALPLLQKSVESDTTINEYREELAKSYFLKKDFSNLEKTYSEIFTLNPNNSNYKFNYAYYLYKLNKYDESIKNYEEGLKETTDEEIIRSKTLTILQINLLDKKDLQICLDNKKLDIISKINNEESKIILGFCELHNSKDYKVTSTPLNNIDKFFLALKKKDTKALAEILDKDENGMLTTYYNALSGKI